nr:uncharacterized protein CI109_000686 [Kwoniella shandongensis]KAA5531114.1 hypothetical protein CI109_000686 [Kwoniella shandongensis]
MVTNLASITSNQRGDGSNINATATLVHLDSEKPVVLGDPVSSESPTPPSLALPSPPTTHMDIDTPTSPLVDRANKDDDDTLPPTSHIAPFRQNTPPPSAVAGPSRTTRQSTLSAERQKRTREGFWKKKDAGGQDKVDQSVSVSTPQSAVAVKPDPDGDGDVDMSGGDGQEDDGDDTSSKAVETPPPTANASKGISLVFRRPPVTTGETSRASTPDVSGGGRSTSANSGSKKKKRMSTTRLNPTRPTRGRRSSPGPSISQASRATSQSAGPLSIFALPPPTGNLPEALRSAIGTPTPVPGSDVEIDSNAPIADPNALRREAAAGFESRLRSRGVQKRDGGERTGVSASGKDVRVGGSSRATAQNNVVAAVAASGSSKKKGKAKAEVEVNKEASPSTPAKEKDLKPLPSAFKALIKKVDEENPSQFRLPQELRTYFAGVATAQRGEYVDAEEARTKYDRKGFQEERDPFRVRDGKQKQISCYVCAGSSLPLHSLTTDPESTWRQIVSCDYCNLSWHLDCLTPPLSSMPNSGRKWMCPNHVEQVMPRRRTLRNNLEYVDIESSGQRNNGNIQIVPEPEEPRFPPLEYEDLVINRKKFRVPEKVIKLDFWDKIKSMRTIKPDLPSPASAEDAPPSQDELDAANLVLALSRPPPSAPVPAATPAPAISLNVNGAENSPRRGRSGDALRNGVTNGTARRTSHTPQTELTTTTKLSTPPPPLPTPSTATMKNVDKEDQSALTPASANMPKIVLRMPSSNSVNQGRDWKVNGEGK